ncbi:hypothetical protein ACFPL7_00895 [Dongia soli]|uniref:Uncharacterized protein n=1 Tax=Dongia soli TaxID=600628 RepID=A0ABU5ED97_9PROT|nr:hypothetical protein [Dongia soli]MDY0884335.1 hypothetical protein [Dongia soli]
MDNEKRRLSYVLFLIAGSGLIAIARAMSLTFVAIKLQHRMQPPPLPRQDPRLESDERPYDALSVDFGIQTISRGTAM